MLNNVLFYITLILFSFGQLARISFIDQQINLYLYEVFLVLNLSILVIKYKLVPFRFYIGRYKGIFIFSIILLISYLINIFRFNLLQNFVGSLYLARVMIYFIYFIYLMYHVKEHKDFKETLIKSLGVYIFLTIFTSIIQYLYYQDLRNLFYLGWDPHLYRMFGVFFDTFVSATVYGLLFFFALFKFKGLLRNILLTVFIVFIALTFSRMAYISFIITLFSYLIYKKSYKALVLSFFAFVILIFIIPKPFGEGVNLTRLFSIESRIGDYRRSLPILIKNPILGIGYDRIRYVKNETGHAGSAFSSSFLTILVSSGIVGLIAFVLVLFNFAKINIYVRSYVIFLSIFSLSDNVLLQPFILFLFLTMLILEVGAHHDAPLH